MVKITRNMVQVTRKTSENYYKEWLKLLERIVKHTRRNSETY